jgi:hypothetical protein
VGKAGSLPFDIETYWGPTQIGLQLFNANIRLLRKELTVANTLAYYKTAKITAVKSLIELKGLPRTNPPARYERS